MLGFSESNLIASVTDNKNPEVIIAETTIEGPRDYCIVFKNDKVGENQFERSEIGEATYYALHEAGRI